MSTPTHHPFVRSRAELNAALDAELFHYTQELAGLETKLSEAARAAMLGLSKLLDGAPRTTNHQSPTKYLQNIPRTLNLKENKS